MRLRRHMPQIDSRVWRRKSSCGIDVMVACDLAKVIVGVRFSYPAPNRPLVQRIECVASNHVMGVRFSQGRPINLLL